MITYLIKCVNTDRCQICIQEIGILHINHELNQNFQKEQKASFRRNRNLQDHVNDKKTEKITLLDIHIYVIQYIVKSET